MEMREGSVLCVSSGGMHRLYYRDLFDPNIHSNSGGHNAPPVLLVHYLTGTGHYFDWLARALVQDGYRVIIPDMPGRGKSDHLKNPLDYNLGQYMHDLCALMAQIGIKDVSSLHWVGASMGGLLGILMAGLAITPIKTLSLIDIGPFIPKEELSRIASLRREAPIYKNMDDAQEKIRLDRAPVWGPVPQGYWEEFTRGNVRILDDGTITAAYDPEIFLSFGAASSADLDLWASWDFIQCPVMAVRGGLSKTLPRKVAQEMAARKPAMRLHTLEDCGHVPSMAMPGQIDLVRAFLKDHA